MSEKTTSGKLARGELSLIVTRADGTIEDFGVVSVRGRRTLRDRLRLWKIRLFGHSPTVTRPNDSGRS